ncbi:Tyrosine-protein kinase [Trema orientale]|uniref:Tyrosine-protein kinase n=1 Tax=Trema orientale TaxID=63057 RepID=A0A2P5FZA0_TREOI|nr:Tyrosine-protein kinase [Trema orientale]
MKCFFPFKDKSKSKQKAESAPELRNRNKPKNPALDRETKSSSSLPSPRSIPELYKEKEHTLRVFSFQELREATNGFNRLLKLGEGGFGSVYKGTIRPVNGQGNPIVVAIKKLNQHSLQGHKQWLAEVQFLGVLSHPHLVKLIGYCSVDGERGIQRLLVYEFMPNRSLEDHLFNRALPTLPWIKRLQIILGAAEGLAYLHDGLEVKVVGTYGYAAPEYVETGHLTVQSDIWSFGVVLYEILTGRRALERNRPTPEQKLLEWVKHYPADSKKFSMIMDTRLRGDFSPDAAKRIAKLADSCLNKNAKDRPTMSQIVEILKQAIQESQGSSSSTNGNASSSRANVVKGKSK